jgi:hypothetical protein
MPQVRFVGPEPVVVPFLGRSVDPDEVVNLSDEQFAARDWDIPGSWDVVATPKKSKED